MQYPAHKQGWVALLLILITIQLLSCTADSPTKVEIPDQRDPVVNWLSPTSGATLVGEVELRISAKDASGISSISIYLDGSTPDGWTLSGTTDSLYTILWNTTTHPDDTYILTATATDANGNISISPSAKVKLRNHSLPSVIWVPDDFEKIQDAINASRDGDTVRVRPGRYEEGLLIYKKNIRLESSDGPEQTTILTDRYADGITVFGSSVKVRGFSVSGAWNGISLSDGSIATISNCIIYDKGLNPELRINGVVWVDAQECHIRNCLFLHCDRAIKRQYAIGSVFNNMFIDNVVGIYQQSLYQNWIQYDYNLFFDNQLDYKHCDPAPNDINQDPLFLNGDRHLQPNSPALDAGHPGITDKDGSRSDIGIYGGPDAY